MPLSTPRFCRLRGFVPPRFAPFLWPLGLFAAVVSPACGATVSGTVSTLVTGNRLEGARVEAPALGRFALTDNTGWYTLTDLPAGEHEIVASYTGMDPARRVVRLDEAGRAQASFDLDSAIYKMDPFTVADVREGNALAHTAQRNAVNVKNVIAADALGAFATPGDLAMRLAGVVGGIDDEGNVQGVFIRGQGPQHNRLTIDGIPLAVTTPLARGFQATQLTAGMFDQLEVIKGHTPDKPVSSLGGTVNLTTHSPLALKEKRQFNFSLAGRLAPSFGGHVKLRRDHPLHPLVHAGYREVFGVRGGERNLGVALNYSYTEHASGGFRTARDYQNTTSLPAFLYSWATQDLFNVRKQTNASAKVDFLPSPSTRLSLNVIYNDTVEPAGRTYEVTALTAQTVAALDGAGNPVGPGAILPNYSATFTEARPLPASVVRVNQTMTSSFSRTRAFNFSGQHDFRRGQLDWTIGLSSARPRLGSGGGGALIAQAAGVGWRLDRSGSDLYPEFTLTGGTDPTDANSYRPSMPLIARGNARDSTVRTVRANFAYPLPAWSVVRTILKAGFDFGEQTSGITSHDRRWNYIGSSALPTDPSIVTWMNERTGLRVPMFETASFFRTGEPDPALWREDRYFGATQNYINNRSIVEHNLASYLMARGEAARLGFLAGARLEMTDTDGFGYVRPRFFSTPARQAADPEGAARQDYENNRKRIADRSGAVYPSVHLTYDLRPRLKARASWSTSYSAPPFGMLLPSEMPDDASRTLTVNNEELRPQFSKEWDAALEYALEPAGFVSLGWFYKNLSDTIVTGVERGRVPTGPDNGYNGDYADYQIITSDNAGTAVVNGWELSYQQQLAFLPGWLRTFSLQANYTWLRTHGRYDGRTRLTTGQVVGFTPRSGNASVTWRYKALGVRARVNYMGEAVINFTAATPARNLYRFARTVTDAGVTFALRPQLQLFCDVSNLSNEPLAFYRYVPSQRERTILNGTTLTAGVNGRF